MDIRNLRLNNSWTEQQRGQKYLRGALPPFQAPTNLNQSLPSIPSINKIVTIVVRLSQPFFKKTKQTKKALAEVISERTAVIFGALAVQLAYFPNNQ